MKKFISILLSVLILSCKNTSNDMDKDALAYPVTGSIERLDPAIDALIAQGAVIEILADGYQWTEGPLWVADGSYLLYSDVPSNSIYKWSEEKGAELYLNPSGYTGQIERGGEPGSNGLNLDNHGKLVLCQHGDRKMARMIPDLDAPAPVFETLADNYNGMKFNSPNDAVYDLAGNLFFTDPPYGLVGQMNDPVKETPFQGVYSLDTSGVVHLITDKMSRPNGIGLSPDNSRLYVANSDPDMAIYMEFTLDENRKVISERLFYDATSVKEKGLPDGLKVDKAGNIWATGPGGVWIFNPAGKVLGKIKPGESTSNCALDESGNVLYMTCDNYLMRVRLGT